MIEGGDAGGELVIAGPPEHLVAHPEASHAARFLWAYQDGHMAEAQLVV